MTRIFSRESLWNLVDRTAFFEKAFSLLEEVITYVCFGNGLFQEILAFTLCSLKTVQYNDVRAELQGAWLQYLSPHGRSWPLLLQSNCAVDNGYAEAGKEALE